MPRNASRLHIAGRPPLALTGASGTRWHNQSNCSSVNRIAMRLYWHHARHRLRGFGIGSNQTGLSNAARAWDKHAEREGSAIEKATGGVDAKNARASEFVDSVLNDPARTVEAYTHPNYGDIIDIRKPDGSGLRYNQDGSFMGFIDPSKPNK